MNWTDISTLFGIVVAVSTPIITVLGWLHKRRNVRSDLIDSKIDKLDRDLSGLTVQLAETALDAERRYVSRVDHTESVNQLNGTMGRLDDSVRELNQRLFQIARGQ